MSRIETINPQEANRNNVLGLLNKEICKRKDIF
jgi:hypothetical protein